MLKNPEHRHVVGATTIRVTAWMVTVWLVVRILPEHGSQWWRTAAFVILIGAPPLVFWLVWQFGRRRRARMAVPPTLFRRACHGTLAGISDSQRRPLRPIGGSARGAAERTSALLSGIEAPGVRIFLATRPPGTSLPPVPHTISRGHSLVLVESVCWPDGRYRTTSDGRVHCDGVYIGQSTSALTETVRSWRAALPSHHKVTAVVVVHSTTGTVELPDTYPPAPLWVSAEECLGRLWQLLEGARGHTDHSTVATLLAGVADAA
ncbi:hypothetical protein [Amycolatopsis sp. NBC_00438]|uniref:hypothetical protein n=1 Tax=Amycolatopsis sp. NBC_00438 TaxID=2903558 RepID=UPI002E20591C